MALSIGELAGYVTLDNSDFEKKLRETDKSLTDAQVKFRTNASKISKTTGTALAAGLAVGGAAAYKFAQQASDLGETVNKSNVIFGENAKGIERWAGGAAKNMGLSKQAALDSAASFGDMFMQIGFGGDAAAKMSKGVVQMSADLGSFNNLPTADVSERIAAAFRGEYDSLQALIPNINAARVEKVALAETGKKSASALTAQEKAAAVLAIVQKDGARAMGDFARTSDSAANRQKILTAQTEDLGAQLGTKLLPAMNRGIGLLIKLVTWVGNNQKAVGILVGVVGGLAAGVWAVSTAIAAWSTITKVATGVAKVFTVVQRALNMVMRANPIGIVITIIALLVAGLILAYKKSETFRRIVDAAMNGVKKVFQAVWSWIKDNFVPFFTKTLPDAFRSVVDWVKRHWKVLLSILTGPIGAAVILIITHRDKIKAVFQAIWSWVSGTFRRSWSGLKLIFTDPLQAAKNIFDNTIGRSSTVRNLFSGIWDWVSGTFKRTWSGLKLIFTDPIQAAKNIFQNLLGGGGPIRGVFSRAVDAIGNIWDKLENKAKAPIRFIVETVLNRGLIAGFNKIADFVNADNIGTISLPRGFETGGFTGHGPRSKPAGVVHAGEVVFDQDAVAAAGGPSRLDGFRRMLKRGAAHLPGFERGGIVGRVASAVKGIGSNIVDALTDPASLLKKVIGTALDAGSAFLGSPFGQVITKLPGTLVSEAVDWLKGKMSLGGGGARGGIGAISPLGGNGLVSWHGGTFTQNFARRLQRAYAMAPFSIFQGGWNPGGVAASGTTHDKDAIDATASFSALAALRRVGLAAWMRGPAQGFIPHIHGVPLPGAGIGSASAQWQAQDYLRGGNGLFRGTFGATRGMHPVAENGFEIVMGPQLKAFRGGERVLNHRDSKRALLQEQPVQLNYYQNAPVGYDAETAARKVAGSFGDQLTMAGMSMGAV